LSLLLFLFAFPATITSVPLHRSFPTSRPSVESETKPRPLAATRTFRICYPRERVMTTMAGVAGCVYRSIVHCTSPSSRDICRITLAPIRPSIGSQSKSQKQSGFRYGIRQCGIRIRPFAVLQLRIRIRQLWIRQLSFVKRLTTNLKYVVIVLENTFSWLRTLHRRLVA
jgi:hypothetical protein